MRRKKGTNRSVNRSYVNSIREWSEQVPNIINIRTTIGANRLYVRFKELRIDLAECRRLLRSFGANSDLTTSKPGVSSFGLTSRLIDHYLRWRVFFTAGKA